AVAKLNPVPRGRKPEEVMKSSKKLVSVAILAAMMMVGAVSAHADLLPQKRNQYFANATEVLPRKRSVYFESASELRQRGQYFADVVLVQIVIRQRNEWFAKASNLLRRPQ